MLHNIVHLLFGIVGIAASKAARPARQYLLFGGVIYLVLFVYGIVIDKASSVNFIPLNDTDDVLHIGLAAGMIGLALALGREATSPTRTA